MTYFLSEIFILCLFISMQDRLVCPICGNQDPSTLRKVKNTIICRKCIHYQREALFLEEINQDIHVSDIHLEFELSMQQKKCASQVKQAIKDNKDVLLWAVCGAGKTEMMIDSIAYTLQDKGVVGFLIPRRQVVIEVANRLQQNFPNAKVVKVCQGFQQDLRGDIIVATTHQAVRYPGYFDLLILDEPDAFPYKGNDILASIVLKCKKKAMIYSTATPSKELLDLVEKGQLVKVELNSRYTQRPMIVPKLKIQFSMILWLQLLRDLSSAKRSVLIFVPTKIMAKYFYIFLKLFIQCAYVTSESLNKEAIIEAFRNKEIPLLISTSILERGVTFKDIDVFIYQANHPIFDQAALIQMAGRVGRDMNYWQGRCIFYSSAKSTKIRECIERIEYANQSLSMV